MKLRGATWGGVVAGGLGAGRLEPPNFENHMQIPKTWPY